VSEDQIMPLTTILIQMKCSREFNYVYRGRLTNELIESIFFDIFTLAKRLEGEE
jgi:hypothetical protein